MAYFIDHVGDERYNLVNLGISMEGYKGPEVSVSRTFFRDIPSDHPFWPSLSNIFTGGVHVNISDGRYAEMRGKQRKEGKTTVLSIGCASGEEALSIGMVAYSCQEWMKTRGDSGEIFGPGMNVEIVGVDLIPENIELAGRGRYPINFPDDIEPDFLRTCPESYWKYFEKGGDGKWVVKEDVRKMVKLEVGDIRTLDIKKYDPTVIVCRYVLDDFDEKVKKDLAAKLKGSAPAVFISQVGERPILS